MNSNKAESKALRLGQGNFKHKYRLGDREQSCGDGLGGTGGSKAPHVLAAQKAKCCINSSMASRLREGVVPSALLL